MTTSIITTTTPPSSPPPHPSTTTSSLPVDLEVSLASFLGKTTSKPRYVHPYFWGEEHLRTLLIDAESLASSMSPISSPVRKSSNSSRYRRSPPRSPISRILLSPLAKSIRQHYAFDAFDHGRLSGIKKCLELMNAPSSITSALKDDKNSSSSSCLFGLKLNPDLSAMFKTNSKALTAEFPSSASNALTRVVSDMFLRGANEDHFEFGGNNVLPKNLRVTRTFTSANGAARVPFFYGDVVKELPVDAIACVRPRRNCNDNDDVNVVDRRIAAAKDEEASEDENGGVKFRYAAVIDSHRHDTRYASYGMSKRGWSILRRIKPPGEEFADIDDEAEDGDGKRQLRPYYFAVLIALAQQQWMEQPTFETYTAHVLVPTVPLGVTIITATFSNAYLSILLGGGERNEWHGNALPAPSTVEVKVRRFSMDPEEAGRRGGFLDCMAEITSEAVKRTMECLEEQNKSRGVSLSPPPPPVLKEKKQPKEENQPVTSSPTVPNKTNAEKGMPPMGWYYPSSDKENETTYKLSPSKTTTATITEELKDTKALRPRSSQGCPTKKKPQSPKKLRSKQNMLNANKPKEQRPRAASASKIPAPVPVFKRKALDEIPRDTNNNHHHHGTGLGMQGPAAKKLRQMMPT